MTEIFEERAARDVGRVAGSGRGARALVGAHAAIDAAAQHGSLRFGPDAAAWVDDLLDVTRFEVARADGKANTLFRFYGVVAAVSVGLLAGQGW